ncbi:MAG: HU family DNA-binding protein [Candidatus Hydrogenedentota bacterium]
MIVAASGLTEIEPGGDCDDQDPDVRPISTDGDILAGLMKEARLSERAAVALYNALLDTIVAEVNAGEAVDIDGFGAFYEAQEASISKRSARTGRNPQTGKEIKIAAQNLSPGEQGRIGALTRQLARRWAREGGGAEVTVTKKNTVKFKAGAELSGQVN